MDVQNELKRIQQLFEEALVLALQNLECSPETRAVAQYAALSGGKRIRPLLMLSIGADIGLSDKVLIRPAIAIELLHVASLIHDDLPAVDNDDMRRGRNASHVQFGEGRALLAADYLIAAALEMAEGPDGVPRNATRELARAFAAVSDGQVLDLIGESEQVPLSVIHERKTGAMFQAAFVIPALQSPMAAQAQGDFRELGRRFGYLFQIVDDLIDVFGTDQERGRRGSSDAKNHKRTIFTGKSFDVAHRDLVKAEADMFQQLTVVEQSVGDTPLTRVRGVIEMHRARLAPVVARAIGVQ